MSKRQKTEFGEYLVAQIKSAKMSQEKFYTDAEITKPYFYDILTGSPPPSEVQNKMLSVLENQTGINQERRNTFLNLAAKSRDEIPADIAELIKSHPNDWDIIRELLINKVQCKQRRLYSDDILRICLSRQK